MDRKTGNMFNVLMVDDDEDDQYLIGSAFSEEDDFSMQFANDGHEGLAKLSDRVNLPDLVLLDLNMPKMGGFELLKHLQIMLSPHILPVIVLTTSNQNDDIQKAFELGATKYIIKPKSINVLGSIVENIRLFLKQDPQFRGFVYVPGNIARPK